MSYPTTCDTDSAAPIIPPSPKRLREDLEETLYSSTKNPRVSSDDSEAPILCLLPRILNDVRTGVEAHTDMPSMDARKALDTTEVFYPEELLDHHKFFFLALIRSTCDPKQRMNDLHLSNTDLRMYLCYKLAQVKTAADVDKDTLNVFALGLYLLKTDDEAACFARALNYKGLCHRVHVEMNKEVQDIMYTYLGHKRFDCFSAIYKMALFEFAHRS